MYLLIADSNFFLNFTNRIRKDMIMKKKLRMELVTTYLVTQATVSVPLQQSYNLLNSSLKSYLEVFTKFELEIQILNLSGIPFGILGYRGNRESRAPSRFFFIREPKSCIPLKKPWTDLLEPPWPSCLSSTGMPHPSLTKEEDMAWDKGFFLGRIFWNLVGNRNSRYPSRNADTGQKNSVTFEFEVEKKVKYMRLLLILSIFDWRSGKPSRLSTKVTGSTPATVPLFFLYVICSKNSKK
jgi:hypothetical protein